MTARLSRNETIVDAPTTAPRRLGWDRLLPSWPLILALIGLAFLVIALVWTAIVLIVYGAT